MSGPASIRSMKPIRSGAAVRAAPRVERFVKLRTPMTPSHHTLLPRAEIRRHRAMTQTHYPNMIDSSHSWSLHGRYAPTEGFYGGCRESKLYPRRRGALYDPVGREPSDRA